MWVIYIQNNKSDEVHRLLFFLPLLSKSKILDNVVFPSASEIDGDQRDLLVASLMFVVPQTYNSYSPCNS